jgi:hypothetical protein
VNYSDLLAEANDLAARVIRLEQPVPDTYQSMLVEVNALLGRVTMLENALPPIVPPTKQTLTPTNLRAIGGWQMPSNSGLGFVSGGLYVEREGRNLTFFTAGKETHCKIHKLQCNLDVRGTVGANQKQWPKCTQSWAIKGYHDDARTGTNMRVRGVSRPNPGGPLLVGSWDRYATFDKAWYGPYLSWIADGGAPIGVVHTPAQVNLRTYFGNGFCKIPQWFSDRYLGGRTFGVGHGGYYSGQALSLGPTLFVCDTPEPGTTMINNALPLLYFNAWNGDPNNAERRFGDYTNGLWAPDPDANGVGYWVDGVNAGPVWIDTPTITGLCYWTVQGVGARDYTLQSEAFSNNRRTRLYVYSPETIAAVASGQLAPNRARAAYYEWTNPFETNPNTWMWPVGSAWDGEYLYVAYKAAGSDLYDTQPVIMAYEVI